MINQSKNVIKKISKGYRLKSSTHKLIDKIQLLTNRSKDTVISKALKLYFIQINVSTKKTKSDNKVIQKHN